MFPRNSQNLLKILHAIERFRKVKTACSYFSLHHGIFESEKFRFSFSTKISLTWGVKCEKIINPENRREFIR